MIGWLSARLGIAPRWQDTNDHARMRSVELDCANGDRLVLTRENNTAIFERTGQADRHLPLTRRPLGDELAEELRRLDADQIYAEALSSTTGLTGLDERPGQRVHIWKDPTAPRRAAVPAGASGDTPATAPAGSGGPAQ
jgi:glucose-6-phosphate dehydrogenase assembly protein OpcA